MNVFVTKELFDRYSTDDDYVTMHDDWIKKGQTTAYNHCGSCTYFDPNNVGSRPVTTNKITKPMYTKK